MLWVSDGSGELAIDNDGEDSTLTQVTYQLDFETRSDYGYFDSIYQAIIELV